MNSELNRPKGFGEILDQTFRLSKNRFVDFFMIFLILLGPIFLLQALFELMAGTSFFRATGTGDTWFEQFITSFEGGTPEPMSAASVGAGIASALLGIVSTIFTVIAGAAVLIGVNHIRKNEEFTAGSVIKQAFKRFWPLVGSSLLFGLIFFGMIFAPIMIIGFGGFFAAGIGGAFTGESFAGSLITILIMLLLLLAAAVGIGYLITRWSFYLGVVTIDQKAPGIGRSWNLTKGRGWIAFGVFIILMLLTGVVSGAFELTLGLALGYSVLYSIILNLVTIVTSIITSVGFAVMFFDLKSRNEAEDLQEMIEDYKQE
jgi:membrane-anchored glycerophosphoryl diester phosphodiesterase (GDPDase)